MGALCAYGAEVIGRALGFFTEDQKDKVKAAEVRIMTAGDGEKRPPVSGDTRVPDICGQ